MIQSKKTSPSPLVITRTMLWVLVFGYGVFLIGQSTYQNYHISQEIAAEKNQINELQKTNHLLELSLIYFQSNAFKEVQARQWLGLKGKDEHVVALPLAKTEAQLSIVVPETGASASPTAEHAPTLSPPKAWWKLFFGKEN